LDYFTCEIPATRNQALDGKTRLVSGSGNVARYTLEKLLDLGAKPACLDAAVQYGMAGNYAAGADIAGFVKVVDAMLDQCVV
jgi:glutamate dehydrogenase/leucine dehydrogenase